MSVRCNSVIVSVSVSVSVGVVGSVVRMGRVWSYMGHVLVVVARVVCAFDSALARACAIVWVPSLHVRRVHECVRRRRCLRPGA